MLSVKSKQHHLAKIKVVASSIGLLVGLFIFASEYKNILQNSSRFLVPGFGILVALIFSAIVGVSVTIVVGFLLKPKEW
ncbi:MAG: hypothetical protein ABFC24_01290 [Methanoregulaceae archaeon]